MSGPGWDEECRGWSGTWGGRIREDPRGSERLGEREGGVVARGNSGLSRLSGANPDAGRPFPGPFWDVKALKNPPPTPGLNSSLKKHTSNPKMQLRTRGGFLNLKSKLHLDFTNVPHAVH